MEDRRTHSQSLEDRDYQEEGVKKLPQKAGSAVPEGEEAQVPNEPKYFPGPKKKKRKTKDHRRQSVTNTPASSSTVAVDSSPFATSRSYDYDSDFVPEPDSIDVPEPNSMKRPFPGFETFMYDGSMI